MENKMLLGVVGVLVLVVSMFGFVEGVRDLVPYGNIMVESSVLDALTIENQSYIMVMIDVNQSLNQDIEITKSEILSGLNESELGAVVNLKDSEWFAGRLTIKGLEKLKSNKNIVRIIESRGGGTTQDKTGENDEINETENNVGKQESIKEKFNPFVIFWVIVSLIIILGIIYLRKRNIK